MFIYGVIKFPVVIEHEPTTLPSLEQNKNTLLKYSVVSVGVQFIIIIVSLNTNYLKTHQYVETIVSGKTEIMQNMKTNG